jgi:heme/copper-type cytochrome/quinol oxidase subunit 2
MAYFISTGIFWGQCMEVCGRYHHWMPIVVYFMKRDIFLLWCAHFIFLKADNDVLELLEQHTSDYVRTVSHDSENWAIELN